MIWLHYQKSHLWLRYHHFKWMLQSHSLKSTVSSQFFGRGSAPGLFFSLYHSSEPCFLSSLALGELLMFTLTVCRTCKSDTRWWWTDSFTHTGSHHLHMASLHFLAMSVSNTCITDDDRENKDEQKRREESGLKWNKDTSKSLSAATYVQYSC